MTGLQMATKIGEITMAVPTVVSYVETSGLSDWSDDISGSIAGTSSSPYYTS